MVAEGQSGDVSSTPTVGIILPPPELRNILEKTAGFVAKNGMEFAERIRKEKEGETKFNFLNPTNPYHAYFLHKIEEIKSGVAPASSAPAEEKKSDERIAMDEAFAEMELRGPPPAPQFLYEPPTYFQQDVDLVRLTAQFVARNGREFLTRLIQQEASNNQFDFLKPHHVLFPYFQRLVEQYSKVFIPTSEMKSRLIADADDPFHVLDRVMYAVEWQKREKSTREVQETEADKERVAFAQIDWHDFVVVQTIDFTTADVDLPTPITINQLGQRLLDMDRIERADGPGYGAPPPPPPPHDASMDVEMEVDEPQPVRPAAPPTRQPAAVAMGDLKIRKDYDPKAAHRQGAGETMQVSPLTGELVPASRMAEHMRIGLLDPRWREQKEKFEADLAKNSDVRSIGQTTAMSHLKDLAAHRSDVFGQAHRETAIGVRVDSDDQDGDVPMGSAARLASFAAGPPPVMPKPPVPPTPPVRPLIPSAPGSGAPAPVAAAPSAMAPPAPHMPTPFTAPAPPRPGPPSGPLTGSMGLMPTPMSAPMMSMMPPPMMHGAPPPMHAAPPSMFMVNSAPALSEPPAKRTKADGFLDRLEPEDIFLRTHQGPVTVNIFVTEADPKWNLTQGQVLSVTVSYTDKINDLKQKLQDQMGMPINKQKIQIDDVVLSNTNSVAYYNLTPASPLCLGSKTRGGRK